MDDIQELLNKRAIDVTVNELATAIVAKLSTNQPHHEKKKMLSGIPGIMEIAQCSRSKASKLRKSGVLDAAITSIGRGFLIDENMALELLKNRKKGRKHTRGLGEYVPLYFPLHCGLWK